jgi:hypothetical protein
VYWWWFKQFILNIGQHYYITCWANWLSKRRVSITLLSLWFISHLHTVHQSLFFHLLSAFLWYILYWCNIHQACFEVLSLFLLSQREYCWKWSIVTQWLHKFQSIPQLMMVLNVWICKCSLCYCIYVMARTLILDYEHVYVISVIVMFTCYSVFTVNVPIISHMTLWQYIFITILKSCVISHIKAELTPVFWRCAVHDYGKCWEWPWVCKRNRDFLCVYAICLGVNVRQMSLPYGCSVWHSGLKLNISHSHFRSGSLFLNLENSLLSTKYINCLI